jgi:uncharacterized membrane protein YwzB
MVLQSFMNVLGAFQKLLSAVALACFFLDFLKASTMLVFYYVLKITF